MHITAPEDSAFAPYEDRWYEREADGFRTCGRWRRGRKNLFNLGRKINQMDFERRIMAERKLRNTLKRLDKTTAEPVMEQGNYCERINWNHVYPNWLNYRELHMHHKIVL